MSVDYRNLGHCNVTAWAILEDDSEVPGALLHGLKGKSLCELQVGSGRLEEVLRIETSRLRGGVKEENIGDVTYSCRGVRACARTCLRACSHISERRVHLLHARIVPCCLKIPRPRAFDSWPTCDNENHITMALRVVIRGTVYVLRITYLGSS